MNKEMILQALRDTISLLQGIEYELTNEDAPDDNSQKADTILGKDLNQFLRDNHASVRLQNAIYDVSISKEFWEKIYELNPYVDMPHLFLGDKPAVRDLVEKYRPTDVLKVRGVGKKTVNELEDLFWKAGIDWS